jgi:hypothetical protein
LHSESKFAKALSEDESAKTEVLSILSEINATFKEHLAYAGREGRAAAAVGGDKRVADASRKSMPGN